MEETYAEYQHRQYVNRKKRIAASPELQAKYRAKYLAAYERKKKRLRLDEDFRKQKKEYARKWYRKKCAKLAKLAAERKEVEIGAS